jgi:predicted O-linked N-acetylglucosamine transferase (SPINDLY family)
MADNMDQEMTKAVKLAQSGKLKPAIAILERLVAASPGAVPVRYNLALFLLMGGRVAEALPHLDRILRDHPGHAPSLFSKAKGLLALDRAEEALPLLQRLATGGDAERLLGLGNAYRSLQRTAEAVETFRRLTRAAPGLVGGHINLALLLIGAAPEAALPVLENAVRLHPCSAELHAMLGQCLLRLGRHQDAAQRLRQALSLDPSQLAAKGHLLRCCREMADWDGEEALFAELRTVIDGGPERRQLALPIQDAIFYPFDGPELRRIATAEARFRVPGPQQPVLRAEAASPPRLVVGYLSPDFREHATMHLAGDIFGHHDRTRVRPIAYSVGPDDGSGWRDRLGRDCEAFVDLAGLGDRAAAARIAADGVHILVDMSVFTRHARPGIAALRPAPRQVVWLGLAASSGAPWLDYAIVDEVLVPPRHRDHFSEKLVLMPHSYQANLAWSPPAEAPPPRSELGLPEDGLVLCSFNGHRKLDRASFGLWMRVLDSVPDSVLWQLAPPEATRLRLQFAAEAAGIDPARLVWAPLLPRAQHLRRIAAADLFIDALVCGAHTTAADALRMGVPLVTAGGNRLASRVAASLLHAVGLPELVAENAEGLLALAVALGRDRPRLAALRARLAELLPASPAFDPKRFAADLERAFESMWALKVAGQLPQDIYL